MSKITYCSDCNNAILIDKDLRLFRCIKHCILVFYWNNCETLKL